jgi:hypothetical protein
MENLTRRKVIAATALTVLGPLPLKAATEADVEIARLYAAYVEAEERDNAAFATWDEARGEAVTAAKAKKGIVHKRGTPAPPRFRAMPIEEWEAAIAEQVEALGYSPLQASAEAAQNARYEAWQALADAPAKSVTGIALKLVALFQWDDELQEAWSGKGVCELGHTMCLAARADALRLAGLPHTFGTEEPEGEYVEEVGA